MGPKATDRRAQAAACQSRVTRYRKKQNEFLSRIITCDETWVHHYQKASSRQRSGSTCRRQAPRYLRCSHLQARLWLAFSGTLRELFLWTLCLQDIL